MRKCGTALDFWIPDGPTSGAIVEGEAAGKPSYNKETATACLKACGNRRSIAIDGGAYVGTFAAHLINQFRQVLAFEPILANYECLKLNVPKAECYNAALSDKTEPVSIGQAADKLKTFQWCVGEKTSVISVPGQAIDDLNLFDLSLLKLDVEGHELNVLRGAEWTIRQHRPVVLIEEKFDPKKRAAALLTEWGMKMTGQWKHDMLFCWS
jgi:FkbM family methyltransferase